MLAVSRVARHYSNTESSSLVSQEYRNLVRGLGGHLQAGASQTPSRRQHSGYQHQTFTNGAKKCGLQEEAEDGCVFGQKKKESDQMEKIDGQDDKPIVVQAQNPLLRKLQKVQSINLGRPEK